MPKSTANREPNTPKVLEIQQDGAGNRPAVSTEIAAQMSGGLEHDLEIIRQIEGFTFSCSATWDALQSKMTGRPRVNGNELSGTGYQTLVNSVPRKGEPLLAEVVCASLCNEGHGSWKSGPFLEREFVLVDLSIFQRTKPAEPNRIEERLLLGSWRGSFVEFCELFTIEFPHAPAQRLLAAILKSEKQKLADFEKRLAAMPPVKTPEQTAAEQFGALGKAIASSLIEAGVISKEAKGGAA